MAFGKLVLTLLLSILGLGSGQWQVMGPDKPVQVMVGEDAVFSCFLSPKTSAEAMEVRFFRDDFNVMVHVYREGKDQHDMQMPAYQGRTELLKDFIEEGRVSLRLKKVTLSDIGFYGCWFSFQDTVQEATWSLQVSALGSAPLVSIMGYVGGGGIQLLCNSSGWSLQPTVKWKDLQGHDLPSDPKGNADIHGLFEVETSLIVQENAGSVLCSIQYSDHSPEMESRVWIRESFFHPIRWGLLCIILGIIFLFLFVVIIVLSRSFYKLKGKIWAELEWRRNHGVSELREARKYAVEVTLDPETAHPQLHFYGLKVVHHRIIGQRVPYSDKRFARKCVVASQSFQAGKHYWEVDVGYNKMWWVGVCQDSVDRKVKDVGLSPSNGYWVFGLNREEEYLTFETHSITLHPRTPLTRVGIFLDCEGETISFFNINDQSLIHTLRCKFEGFLRPYIQHYGNDEKNGTPIVICPVSPRPEKEEPSDTDNLDPCPQVTTPFLPRWCSRGIIPHTLPQETELPLRPQSPAADSSMASRRHIWPIHVGSRVMAALRLGKGEV